MNKHQNDMTIESSQCMDCRTLSGRGIKVNEAFTYSLDVARTDVHIRITDCKKGEDDGKDCSGRNIDRNVNKNYNESNITNTDSTHQRSKMRNNNVVIIQNQDDNKSKTFDGNVNGDNKDKNIYDKNFNKQDTKIENSFQEKEVIQTNENKTDDISEAVPASSSLRQRKFSSLNQFGMKKLWRKYSLKNDNNDNFYYFATNLWNSLDEISIIGMKHCADSNRSLINRVMWSIFIIFGFLLAVYQVKDRVMYYLKYPTSIDYDIVTSHITLPQVTVCNNNFIKKSSAANLSLVEYFRKLDPLGVRIKVENYHNLTYLNNAGIIEARKFLSPGLEQLVYCIWNGQVCPVEIIGTTFTNAGQCIIVNPSKANSNFLNGPGALSGLVLVHDPKEPPQMLELALNVNLGEEVNVAVSVTNITRLKHPHGICTDQEGYHFTKCKLECVTRIIISNCSCRPIYMEEIGNESICNYNEEFHCADKVMRNYYLNSSQNGNDDCPPMCNEVTYQTSVTGSKFSPVNFHYIKPLFENKSIEFKPSDVVILRIYMSSMEYTKVSTVKAYSEMALLSDLGGALGLLLGSTFLTVFEAFELFWDFCLYTYARKKNWIKIWKA
ncbi:hypothetical protein HELRODRAFT_180236 [Helobdella robusta]|uniref:Uncharacterized protein n=1 Tax=Helobdella robusta TaxID=6412 RepID=T1FFL7_HELRO|nr:hypothetical protein HELRODRAFT_180236 [Helobdella robusta]ESN94069.1 hypothetical protein HELRODRAFT_180236 [Helobdella robusta]